MTRNEIFTGTEPDLIMIYHLGLGGNLGDVADTMRRAIELLETDAGHVTRVSSLYATSPIGERAGQGYRNAAVELRSELTPERLLEATQKIERECGRIRTEHWGPRTLDIDILLAGEMTHDSPTLRIPHPGVGYRRFVLDPLAEIAPDAVHPLWNVSIRDILEALKIRPLPVGVRTANQDDVSRFLDEQPIQRLSKVHLDPFLEGGTSASSWIIDFESEDSGTKPFRLSVRDVGAPDRIRDILQAMLDEPLIISRTLRQ